MYKLRCTLMIMSWYRSLISFWSDFYLVKDLLKANIKDVYHLCPECGLVFVYAVVYTEYSIDKINKHHCNWFIP